MTHPTCTHIHPHAHGAADNITLDATARHRRRMAMTSDNGIEFLLDLPEARLLRQGDGLLLSDGRVISVIAAKEDLLAITSAENGGLARLAWHIGNRHVEAQIEAERILVRRDGVVADMLERLGATVTPVREPFSPEHGAYHDTGHGHGH
jgi:urease accessory protein